MANSYDVIFDFLDARTFSLAELKEALDAPEGRALLIDSLALRRVVQPTDATPQISFAPAPRRAPLRAALVAAAMFVAVAGGYIVGTRRAPAVVTDAPEATRVVQVESSSQNLLDGGRR